MSDNKGLNYHQKSVHTSSDVFCKNEIKTYKVTNTYHVYIFWKQKQSLFIENQLKSISTYNVKKKWQVPDIIFNIQSLFFTFQSE